MEICGIMLAILNDIVWVLSVRLSSIDGMKTPTGFNFKLVGCTGNEMEQLWSVDAATGDDVYNNSNTMIILTATLINHPYVYSNSSQPAGHGIKRDLPASPKIIGVKGFFVSIFSIF